MTSSFLWFALTFWVFLEARSVAATGVIGADVHAGGLIGVVVTGPAMASRSYRRLSAAWTAAAA